MGTVVNPEFNIDLRTIDIFDVGDVEKGAGTTLSRGWIDAPRVERARRTDRASLLSPVVRAAVPLFVSRCDVGVRSSVAGVSRARHPRSAPECDPICRRRQQ
jgi:hypothetical protein